MRRSSSVKDVGRPHQKRHIDVLKELDLKRLDSYYDKNHSSRESRVSLTELESDVNNDIVDLNKCRLRDKRKVRFVFISGYNDYERNFQALRSSHIFNTHSSIKESLNRLRKNLERLMKHTSLLNHQRNALSAYTTHLRNECDKSMASTNAISEIESLLTKFFKVCDLIPPCTEIKSCDREELIQYENLVSILKCCHQINLRNSRIVFRLLKMILNIHLVDPKDARRIQPQTYNDRFLQYVIFLIENEGRDINILLSHYSNTVWDFFGQFSILNAVAEGDKDKLSFLLNSGVEIFPQYKQRKSGHDHPDISQTLSRTQMMILEIMETIYQKHLFEDVPDLMVSQEQRNCFKDLWQNVPDSHISKEQFNAALHKEYDHLLSHCVEKEKCNIRLRKTKRLVKKYQKFFYGTPKINREIYLNR